MGREGDSSTIKTIKSSRRPLGTCGSPENVQTGSDWSEDNFLIGPEDHVLIGPEDHFLIGPEDHVLIGPEDHFLT